MHTSGHLSVFFTHRQNLHQPVHSKVTGATVGTSFRTLGTRIEAPHVYVLPLHRSTAKNLGKKAPSSKLVNLWATLVWRTLMKKYKVRPSYGNLSQEVPGKNSGDER